MKIECMNFGGSDCREYGAPSGKIYTFHKGVPKDITGEDAEFFLKAANGTAFKKVGMVEKVAKKIKEIIPEKKVDETAPPVLSVPDLKKPMSVPDPEKPGITHQELKELNAKQQTFIIKQIQGEDAKIPRVESEKIELILMLQKEGADIKGILEKYVR